MLRRRWIPMAALAVMAGGCYHQVVQTGRTPSSTVIDKKWVNTWLWGLVEADPIDSRPACLSGVATIESKTSFLNGLVAGVTFGVYTPQHVRITCAS